MRSISMRNIINLNQLQREEQKKNYQHHLQKIGEISRKLQNNKKIKQEQEKIADALRKSKEISKSFKKLEQIKKQKEEDRKLVFTLIQIKKRPRMKTDWDRSDSYRPKGQSKSKSKQQKFEQIQQQKGNNKLALSIVQSSTNVKKYRKKLKGQIDEYLKRRNHMQKIKVIESQLTIPKIKQKKKINIEKRAKTMHIDDGQSSVQIVFADTTSKESQS